MGETGRGKTLLHRLTPDLALIRENQSFKRLFVAAFGSGIGTWFATVALTIDVYARTDNSAAWVSALLVATTLPIVVVGFLLGALVDRWPRRRLMIGADLVRAAVFFAMPFAGSALAIVVLAFVSGMATALFRPAVLAGLPNVVREEQLPLANGLLQSAEFVTTAAAPVLGAALVAATTPSAAYVLNAVSFLVSAALLLGVPAAMLQSEQSVSRGHLSDMKDGFRIVVSSPALLLVLVVFSIAIVPSGFMNVAEIALAKQTLSSGSLGFGLLWTASGIGLVIGSVRGGWLMNRLTTRVAYPVSIALFGLGIAATGAAPTIWVAFATMVVTGFGNGTFMVCNISLVQRGAADNVRGRAFTTIMSTNIAFSMIGLIAAGPLTNGLGARWVYEIAAATMIFAAGVAAFLARPVGPSSRGPALEAEDVERAPEVEYAST